MCVLMIYPPGVTHQHVGIIYYPRGIAIFWEKKIVFVKHIFQGKGLHFKLSKFSVESLKIIVVGWSFEV